MYQAIRQIPEPCCNAFAGGGARRQAERCELHVATALPPALAIWLRWRAKRLVLTRPASQPCLRGWGLGVRASAVFVSTYAWTRICKRTAVARIFAFVGGQMGWMGRVLLFSLLLFPLMTRPAVMHELSVGCESAPLQHDYIPAVFYGERKRSDDHTTSLVLLHVCLGLGSRPRPEPLRFPLALRVAFYPADPCWSVAKRSSAEPGNFTPAIVAHRGEGDHNCPPAPGDGPSTYADLCQRKAWLLVAPAGWVGADVIDVSGPFPVGKPGLGLGWWMGRVARTRSAERGSN